MSTTSRLLAACLLVAALATGAGVYAQDIFGNRRRSSANTYGNVEYDGTLTFVRIRYDVGFSGMGRRLRWNYIFATPRPADEQLLEGM